MVTEKELVDHHVLYEQNSVVEHLLKTDEGLIDNIYNLNEEIMEWWLVTDWLADYLKAEGETIIDDYGCYWWGRTCSGQSICMDAVMTAICESF